jgi:large subunit ribosomal protein L28
MSRRCEVTGKTGLVGYQISHSHIKTKKRQLPNVQSKRIWVPEVERFIRIKMSTRALRSVTKLGLFQFCKKNGLDFEAIVGA